MRTMAARSLSHSFGDVVRAHRVRLGLTQEQVAESAGIHPTYVGMVDRGLALIRVRRDGGRL
jgi:transcriptional regulator with XRE-family HTH domain